MKYIMFVCVFTMSIFVYGQKVSVGVVFGASNAYSHYHNINVDPTKTFSIISPVLGADIDYAPLKNQSFFVNSGLYYMESANAFKVENAPYFKLHEGFEKVKQKYSILKIPLQLGFKHPINSHCSLGALIGGSFFSTNRGSFKEYMMDTLETTMDGIKYELPYQLGFTAINQRTFTVDAGVFVLYHVGNNFSVQVNLSQQMGLRPILDSILNYYVVNTSTSVALLGAALLTSKGDATLLSVGIKYGIGNGK